MEFETDTQREAYAQVTEWMEELYGDEFTDYNDDPSFTLTSGSATVDVSVYAYTWEYEDGDQEDDALLIIESPVVTGANLTPACLHYLLQENDNIDLGSFCINESGTIILSYTLPMSTCKDADELDMFIYMIGSLADKYDDELVANYGGKRGTELES